jgi:hypothetical protein
MPAWQSPTDAVGVHTSSVWQSLSGREEQKG